MKKEWNDAVITKIAVALYVPPNTAKPVHKNRPYHGFVLNNTDTKIDYHFSDGFVLHTKGESLYYLPKGSSYFVKALSSHGCYAINFDANIIDDSSLINVKNTDTIRKSFKIASDEWLSNSSARYSASMRAVYDVIFHSRKDKYIPNSKHQLIAPAIHCLNFEFVKSDLTVSKLAALCGMSEVYFRKIFTSLYGTSPKEYIITKRMEYAKELLLGGEFDITKIAELCGYPEPCHFSREFKKRFGTSPKKFR